LRRVLPIVVFVFCATLLVSGLRQSQPVQAMPNFARALGVSCQTCHTMVPALNAYGRYLQRTFYAPITSEAMRGSLPIYLEYEIQNYSTGGKDSAQPGRKTTVGNLIASFDGFASPVFTYRVENNVYSGDQPTNQSKGPETMWLAYNGLFGGNGHLMAGDDYPGPMPSFMINPSDFEAAFHVRHLAIGTHSYNLENTALSFRFDYDKGPIDAEVAWRGGTTNPLSGGPSDFSILPGTQRAFQWKVADAPPSKPFEFGAFGAVGTYIDNGKAGTLAGPPNIDFFNIWGPYFELDPGSFGKYSPGLYGFYAMAHDSNPGIAGFQTLTPQGPYAEDESIELYEPLLKNSMSFTIRQEYSNNGLGAVAHYYATGVSYQIPHLPYAFARFEVPMGGQSTAPSGRPTWQWALDFLIPIDGGPLNRIEKKQQVAAATPTAPDGKTIYAANCAACHGAAGKGVPGTFPGLAGNADVTAADPKAIIGIVEHGKGVMPAWKPQLSNAAIANVLTYIRTTWGNSASAVSESNVAAVP